MNLNSKTREIVLAGLFIAMGIVLPSLFHLTGISGKVFLPMHIPALIAGFFVSSPTAFIIGFILPYLNSMITGMPPLFPIALIMSFEIGLYGLSVSIFSKKMKLNTIISLILAMITGRIGGGLVAYILSVLFGVKIRALMFVKGSILTGLPGIIIQLIFIPIIVLALSKYSNREITENNTL
ncbi:ECF transporter S component [Caloranaerobacter ferrireducens]|uniref:ECF transporter S component n=1 Tax=Caloranaerobacter ferrireducens TaxID=1323370 RepID=UPI00084D4928|nr:ECF transporter S component [Caloranaerobacter ferrireducens]